MRKETREGNRIKRRKVGRRKVGRTNEGSRNKRGNNWGGGIIGDENYGSSEPCEKGLWEMGIVGKGNFGKMELWGKVLRVKRITVAKLN